MTDKEKLDRMKKLADAMYTAAQYLSTDASGLRTAMDEYHRFIITEYNKQEPALNRADIINSEQYKVSRASVDWYQAHQYADCLDGFEAGAQWQKEKMMKDAVEGNVERGYCEDGISEHFEVFAYLGGRDERFKDLSDGQSVKVIIIKE